MSTPLIKEQSVPECLRRSFCSAAMMSGNKNEIDTPAELKVFKLDVQKALNEKQISSFELDEMGFAYREITEKGYNPNDILEDAGTCAAAGAAGGAAVGSGAPGVGTSVGAVVGGTIGLAVGLIKGTVSMLFSSDIVSYELK